VDDVGIEEEEDPAEEFEPYCGEEEVKDVGAENEPAGDLESNNREEYVKDEDAGKENDSAGDS